VRGLHPIGDLARVLEAEAAVFGGLPYDRYLEAGILHALDRVAADLDSSVATVSLSWLLSRRG